MLKIQETHKKRTFLEHELEFHKKFLILWSLWAILVFISNFSELFTNFIGIVLASALPGLLIWNHFKKYSEYSKAYDLFIEYKNSKNVLMQSGDFILIKKFVEKNLSFLEQYLDDYNYILPKATILNLGESDVSKEGIDSEILRLPFMNANIIDYYHDNQDTLKLHQLLSNRGYNIKPELLVEYLLEEMEIQVYETFKDKINSINTYTIDELINVYLEMYWGEYKKKDMFLYMLIMEKGYIISRSDLENKIEKRKNELELESFERKLYLDDKEHITLSDLDNLTGIEFENFLVKLFTKLGYSVKNIKSSHDQGADLIIEKFGEITVVQAKRYVHKVNNSAVQEVVASIKHYKANKGMVITTNDFTTSAVELAKSNNIILIDRKELINLIERSY